MRRTLENVILVILILLLAADLGLLWACRRREMGKASPAAREGYAQGQAEADYADEEAEDPAEEDGEEANEEDEPEDEEADEEVSLLEYLTDEAEAYDGLTILDAQERQGGAYVTARLDAPDAQQALERTEEISDELADAIALAYEVGQIRISWETTAGESPEYEYQVSEE